MSKCKRCAWSNPSSGLNIDGLCVVCVTEADGIFVPYSGRRPNGDCVTDPCPECGHPRTGVFLCQFCETLAERELRKAIEGQEWEQHQIERWRWGYKPKDDVEWQRKMQRLEEVAQKYGLTTESLRIAADHSIWPFNPPPTLIEEQP